MCIHVDTLDAENNVLVKYQTCLNFDLEMIPDAYVLCVFLVYQTNADNNICGNIYFLSNRFPEIDKLST